jgi:hypothetical protein
MAITGGRGKTWLLRCFEEEEEDEEHQGQARDVRVKEFGVRSNPGGGLLALRWL